MESSQTCSLILMEERLEKLRLGDAGELGELEEETETEGVEASSDLMTRFSLRRNRHLSVDSNRSVTVSLLSAAHPRAVRSFASSRPTMPSAFSTAWRVACDSASRSRYLSWYSGGTSE